MKAKLDLAEIKRYCKGATPEPWTAELDYISAFIPGNRPNGEIIGRWHPSIGDLLSNEQKYANAKFAARARTDLPNVVEALEEAQKKLDAVEAWADEFSLAVIRDKRYELDRILKEGE